MRLLSWRAGSTNHVSPEVPDKGAHGQGGDNYDDASLLCLGASPFTFNVT